MDKRIIFATNNQGKVKEIKMLLEDTGYDVLSLKDAGIEAEIVEDGKTFEENAIIKARTIMELTNDIVLADDSGLEVDYLNKEPGIYSARYLGEDTPYEVKNQYIINKLEQAEGSQRNARFVCAIACVLPDGTTITTQETMEGEIAREPEGENGFGYDPIFYIPKFQCTNAQLTLDQKNKISHRGKALKAMKEKLKEIL